MSQQYEEMFNVINAGEENVMELVTVVSLSSFLLEPVIRLQLSANIFLLYTVCTSLGVCTHCPLITLVILVVANLLITRYN
jgi:hypothetical protein